MEPPSTKKGAQRLAVRLASLNRFISRSAKRNLPFFEILKSAEVFQWGPAQQKAFEAILIDLTTLTPPSPGAPLLLYVAVSHSAVSAAVVQEKLDGQVKKQAPVYFISEVLSLSKKNYIELEKVLYAVLMASRKLQHYFQAYRIIVPSSHPLKDIMRNREATGRIGKWVVEFNEFTIDYVHRSSIQSQALADFIADWTPGAQEEEKNKDAKAWTVFCDGSWGTFNAGAAVVLVAPLKVKTCYPARLDLSCTNNIAEYEALLLGLRKLRAMGIRRAILKTDSQVISGHVDKSSCWGEGEDATLRSKPSSHRYINERVTTGTVALRPIHCKTKARPRRSLLVTRPSSRPEAHVEFGPLQRAPRGQVGYEPHL
jgi:ribonuclease HI